MVKNRVLIFDALNVFMRHYIAHPASEIYTQNTKEAAALLK